MDRRGFLRTLGLGATAVAAAHVLDPERALWVPGARTFFLPTPSPWHDGNNLLTTEKICRDALRVLEQTLTASRPFVEPAFLLSDNTGAPIRCYRSWWAAETAA